MTEEHDSNQGGINMPKEKEPPSIYTVLVGNIGTVYDGPLLKQALEDYGEYKRQSISNYGRAAGEPVTLLKDGEIINRLP